MSVVRKLSQRLRKKPSRNEDETVETVKAEVCGEPLLEPSPEAFVTAAEITGVTERISSRGKYAFKLKLNWSDGSITHSFRGYTEFFNFHCALLDMFPEEAGQIPGSARVIPHLPG